MFFPNDDCLTGRTEPLPRAASESCALLANSTAFFGEFVPCADFKALNVQARCLSSLELNEALKRSETRSGGGPARLAFVAAVLARPLNARRLTRPASTRACAVPLWIYSEEAKSVHRHFEFPTFRTAFTFMVRGAQLMDKNECVARDCGLPLCYWGQ